MPDPYPSEGYQPEQSDTYPTEGYQPSISDTYPTEGYNQSGLSNTYPIPENYPRIQPPPSLEIVSYLALSEADQRKIASANLSEKLVSNDPSHKLLQGHYLNDRRIELEEQAEKIEAKQSIQDKLAANREQHGRTAPSHNRDQGIER